MQAIYAFQKAQVSDFYAARDLISTLYEPDYSALEKPAIDALLQQQKEALALFSESFENGVFKDEKKLAKDPVIKRAIEQYRKDTLKDQQRIGRDMVGEVEAIHQTHYFLLQFLMALADYVTRYAEKQKEKKVGATELPEHEQKFRHNRVLAIIRNDALLIREWERHPFNWEENKETIKEFFQKTVLTDATYQAYAQAPKADFAADHDLLMHLLKKLLFNSDLIDDYFEARDIHWSENKAVVKSMLVKTIKGIAHDTKEVPQITISTDWEEDKAFFEQLYHKTLEENRELEAIVAGRLKNWDIDRVALIDRILLKMAICEMLNFSSIPVKVTINEYIDISKRYSTPKSKQFVNGILDKVSAELTSEGRIKKSGRGLIDNK